MRFLFIILLFPFVAQAQTRLYFSSTEAAPITSVSYHASFTNNSEASRFKLNSTKGSSAITIGTQVGPWTVGTPSLDRQYVSTRMNAGIVFTSGSTTVKAQIQNREYNNGDNVSTNLSVIRIVSEDGLTVRATILSYGGRGSSLEFINNISHRNNIVITSGTTLTSSYTTVLGDRLIFEYGYNDNAGSTPEASSKWGENATDLPEDVTQTTDGAGWIEFSNTITFAGEAGPTRRVTIIQ